MKPAKSNGHSPSPIYLDDPDQPGQSNVIHMKRRKRIAFGWYGGKFSHLGWLLPLLPKCHHYCEPFGGSGAVLLNREPSPVETYNDLDGEIVNFFRVLRDHPEEIIRAIALTPFSREEYYLAIYGNQEGITDIERARRFYIKARHSRSGLAQSASLGIWSNCKSASAGGMANKVSSWLNSVDKLEDISNRLLRVQIENRPALDVIRLYDSPDTLFYCDPPYLHATRVRGKVYRFEMDDSQHRDFAQAVNSCKGLVAVSGYDHPMMDELFDPKRWFKTEGPNKIIWSSYNKGGKREGKRTEVLWTNFDPKNPEGADAQELALQLAA